ncbi:MAG TPA: M28 family peptidase [Gammaproteobacteria bacterium]|nr:M28 family peptidase [Gammaproteobacteria bacterium]
MSLIEALARAIAALVCVAAINGCGRGDDGAGTAAAPAAAARIAPAAVTAAEAINEDDLRRVIAEISSDEYGGRGPGSEGEMKTRAFLANELRTLGFAPAGENGGYEQAVELVGVTTNAPPTWRFESQSGAVELARGTDFIAVSGVQAPSAALDNAELVFVGYGIVAPEYGWNDFKDVDVRGKVIVMLNNDPDWDPQLFAGFERLYYGRWTYKYESAAAHGAAGAIIVHTTPSAGYGWNVVQSSWSGPQFELPAGDEPRTQLRGWVTEDAARRIVGTHDLDALVEQAKSRDFKPVPLGVSTSIALTSSLTRTPSANVLGVMRGSDPELAAQHVIYSAHYDHLGIGDPNAAGDGIYNGARDNASGVAMLVAIGRAFAALPQKPRRSIMLLFVAAEEQGLIGSQYYAEHPTVAPGLIAANVNFDSANIWGETRDITYLGFGKSSLDAVAQDVAAYQGRTVLGDQFPDRGYYYRSDQFNFAKIGVPAFYLRGGTDFAGRPAGWGAEQLERYEARDYHQPSDELTPEWSFAGIVQDARFGFHAGLLVANDDALPQWNAGNEFEAARRAALEAAGTR